MLEDQPIRFIKHSSTFKGLVLVLIFVSLISCDTIGYYSQAARGQLAIVFAREDIQHLLTQQNLAPLLRQNFDTVLSIRNFAEHELGLPANENYLTYVDVERTHVVWNVFAAPEFSTNPLDWCYPIAGCVAYRGYFSEQAAENFANKLRGQGFDVYTGGVDAYSTLGWFDDSILSTVLSRAPYQLAGLIFHELSHQIVYLPGDTTFNESFATAVEREGLRRWLLVNNEPEKMVIAEIDRGRQQDFVELITRFRDEFDSLYQEDLCTVMMRSKKQQLQVELLSEYKKLKQQWDGYAGYDGWFSRPLNNAQLSTVSSYNDLVPFFLELLQASNGDLNKFYEEVSKLAELEKSELDEVTADYR
jgi:predicted aminopeptidase